MSVDKILGIDLGTTNSAFAVMEGGEPKIIKNQDGDTTMPSVVAKTQDGDRIVGQAAKNQRIKNPDGTVESVKRKMGTDATIKMGGEAYDPMEISAMILERIKNDAEEYFGEPVKKAVITVPAYFNDKQRKATKDAGRIAGFDVERIINEPTAAAMTHGYMEEYDKTVLVYDLGGGTFDVSILEIEEDVINVVATDGDRKLGGDDWDQEIVDWIVESFEKEKGVDLTEDKQAMQRVYDAAEETKRTLSRRKKADIELPFITATEEDGPLHIEDLTLTRKQFNEITSHLLERTAGPTENVLNEAGLDSIKEVDDVLLVGGSTRMPMVKEYVDVQTRQINPEEVVALGAAIQGGILSGSVTDTVLLDVTPLSLGVEVKGGIFERIIERNTTIPVEESKVFTTSKDNQTSVDIRVFQGERELAQYNELLDNFTLTGIPPAPAGDPKVKVNFSIDEDGIISVSAEDKATGVSESIKIEGGYNLSDEDIERHQEAAEINAERDNEKRRKMEAINDAEQLKTEARKIIEEFSDDPKLSETDLTDLENKFEYIEEILSKDQENIDTDSLAQANDGLEQALKETGRKLHRNRI